MRSGDLIISFGAVGAVAIVIATVYIQRDRCEPRTVRRRSGKVKAGEDPSAFFWPTSMGQPGSYGNSRHAGPGNLTSAYAWSWTDPHGGRFRSPGIGGTVIDGSKNIYLSWNWGITKFSPDGVAVWEYRPAKHCSGEGTGLIMNSPALWGDAIFASTELGAVFAVNTETGREVWSTQYETRLSGVKAKTDHSLFNNGFVQVGDGVVVTDYIWSVVGISAINGTKLWEFQPDGYVWNFKADFVGDGTFVFQTWEGQVYRCRAADGSVVWTAGGQRGTWTDGNIGLGPNNRVYAVNTKWTRPEPQPTTFDHKYLYNGEGGQLSAYDLEDGRRLWTHDFDRPPNNAMAIGRLGPGAPYSVVMPVGQQERQWEQYWVYALDAETGELRWRFDGPVQKGPHQASGDLSPEEQAALKVMCVPNPWSAPTIDAAGTVYIASQEGPIFALKDANGDGRLEGIGEVGSYQTHRAFCGSEAPSIAPGLMAIASCDTMYVFRFPEA